MIRGRLVLPSEINQVGILKDIIFGPNSVSYGFSKTVIIGDDQPTVIDRLQELALENLGIRGTIAR